MSQRINHHGRIFIDPNCAERVLRLFDEDTASKIREANVSLARRIKELEAYKGIEAYAHGLASNGRAEDILLTDRLAAIRASSGVGSWDYDEAA